MTRLIESPRQNGKASLTDKERELKDELFAMEENWENEKGVNQVLWRYIKELMSTLAMTDKDASITLTNKDLFALLASVEDTEVFK